VPGQVLHDLASLTLKDELIEGDNESLRTPKPWNAIDSSSENAKPRDTYPVWGKPRGEDGDG
jgi:hypothetical protein